MLLKQEPNEHSAATYSPQIIEEGLLEFKNPFSQSSDGIPGPTPSGTRACWTF